MGPVIVSILLATTGRPEQVRALIENIRTTTDGRDIELICAVDADPATRSVVEQARASKGFRLILDYSPDYRGGPAAWNAALAASTGEYVVLAADDLVFHQGWLDEALATMATLPEGGGLVGFNDGHWGEELSTHYLMSRRFVLDHLGGVVSWTAYRHSFTDREANDRARAAGRYAWCPDAYVTHNHWIFGGRQQDSTDHRSLPEHPASQQAYEERKAQGWPPEPSGPAITA